MLDWALTLSGEPLNLVAVVLGVAVGLGLWQLSCASSTVARGLAAIVTKLLLVVFIWTTMGDLAVWRKVLTALFAVMLGYPPREADRGDADEEARW
jgi:hypothetical protein